MLKIGILSIFDKSFGPTKHITELADGGKSNNVANKRITLVIYLHSADNGLVKILLKNTLFVPSYPLPPPPNIFSVHWATKNGAILNFKDHSAELVTLNSVKFPTI